MRRIARAKLEVVVCCLGQHEEKGQRFRARPNSTCRSKGMRQKVIVVGAGVGGLTAAHELIERDFEVHVIERRSQGGGKAMSRRTSSDLPTEHGFRFFPGW